MADANHVLLPIRRAVMSVVLAWLFLALLMGERCVLRL